MTMEASGLDRMRVNVAGEIVEISWNDRDVLLEELAWAADTKSIRVRLEAAERGQPVELNAEQRGRLCAALDDWGSDRLQPEGIARLHAALRQP
jgi:hypothetical protein